VSAAGVRYDLAETTPRFCPAIGCGKRIVGGGWECFDCDRLFCGRACHSLYIAGDWVPSSAGVLADFSGDDYFEDVITSGPGACVRCGDPLPCGADGGRCDECEAREIEYENTREGRR